MNKQVDWIAIRTDYENGVPFRMLANKYDVSKTYIIEKRNKENWNRPTKTDRPPDTQGVPNRDVNAVNRVSLALDLRAKKLTYEEIARQCGYGSASACRKAIQRELDRVVVENVEELRREECYILDRVHRRLYEAAMDEKNKDWQWAADRVLVVSKARRDLMGLDKPVDEGIGPQLIIREVPAGFLPSPTVEAGQ
jgi:hypothetical protein